MSTMKSVYGMLSSPPASYGPTASRSVSSLFVGSTASFGLGGGTDATIVLANGSEVLNPGVLSLVRVDEIEFPEEPTSSIEMFRALAEAATAIYSAPAGSGTLYLMFVGNGVSYYNDLADAFDSAFVVDSAMTQAVEVVCRVEKASESKYKDSDYPSHVVVRRLYESSGEGLSSFAFGCDHSVWKEDGSDLEGGESSHYKSIGGMFQGVRGVAEGSGLARDADKLVKCDRDGTIPVGVLPDSLIVTAEALADEAAAREAGDTRLSNRIESVNSSLSSRVVSLETASSSYGERITAVESDVSSLKDRADGHDTDISGLQSADRALDERLGTVEGKQASDETSIGTLQTDVSDLRRAVDSVEAVVDGLQDDVDTVESKVDGLEQSFAQQQANWTEVSANLGSLTATVGGITTQIASIQSSIESLDRRVTELEGKIDDA